MFQAHNFSRLLLVLLLVVIAVPSALAEDAADHAAAPAAKASPPVKTKLKIAKTDTTIYVGDLHCKSCAKKVARKLYAVKGVVKVRSDVKADVVVVTPQRKKQLDAKALWAASQKAGFQPTKLEGPSGTFKPDPESKSPVLVPEQVARKQQ